MKVLVINAGSSSIKYQLFEMPAEKVLAKGLLEKIGEETSQLNHFSDSKEHKIRTKAADHSAGMKLILDTLVAPQTGVIKNVSEIAAVGHRVVHGGEEFTGSVVIDDKVIASVEKFSDLAPLHNPPNLTGIKAAQKSLPKALQVACFDTAFHTSIPKVAYIYALPYEIYEKYRVRKYGFHGTSHSYVAKRAAKLLGGNPEQPASTRLGEAGFNIITCHLGNGCSITAVRGGKSIDTSMGLTPLEGVVMGTRSGDFDPAILFYLSEKGYSLDELNDMCNKKSGLLGISGVSNDMRNLRERAQAGNERARLAFDIFCYRIKKYIGAYTAVLGRLDALVFTGGIGENAADVRAQVCENLEQIGVKIDPAANEKTIRTEGLISSAGSRVKVYCIPTNEELAIAQDTFRLAK
jgi:acetate kinase